MCSSWKQNLIIAIFVPAWSVVVFVSFGFWVKLVLSILDQNGSLSRLCFFPGKEPWSLLQAQLLQGLPPFVGKIFFSVDTGQPITHTLLCEDLDHCQGLVTLFLDVVTPRPQRPAEEERSPSELCPIEEPSLPELEMPLNPLDVSRSVVANAPPQSDSPKQARKPRSFNVTREVLIGLNTSNALTSKTSAKRLPTPTKCLFGLQILSPANPCKPCKAKSGWTMRL
jgi:uncharacterized membrane protein YqaE (UPF0057 family)